VIYSARILAKRWKFRRVDEFTIRFPLLSDGDHKVAKSYGAWGQKTMYGKKVEGIIRSSFLIDESGKIMAAWYKISPPATVPEALKVLEP
jgi:peroxiredoxin Q/BCP